MPTPGAHDRGRLTRGRRTVRVLFEDAGPAELRVVRAEG
jgi:hypothetical protein